MKRTTIMLPDGLKNRAKKAAKKRGVSLGEIIRSSLQQTLAKGKRSRLDDPYFSRNSVFHDNGPPDVAENLDKYLTEILVEEYEREQRR